jgi:hypothetical protein
MPTDSWRIWILPNKKKPKRPQKTNKNSLVFWKEYYTPYTVDFFSLVVALFQLLD